jgi:3-oxoadipate enol-lactonase
MLIHVNNHAINVEQSGTGEPLLLLHSLGTNATLWNTHIVDLESEFMLVRIDLRGHGQSSISRVPLTIEALADDVVAIADHLGIQRFALAGISLGGMVAQVVAARLGERLTRLVLLDTSLAPMSRPMWRSRAESVRRDGLASIAKDVVARWHAPSDAPSTAVESAYSSLLETPTEGYAAGCDALAVADCSAVAPKIDCPTTVVVGALDTATPPVLAEELTKAIRGARLVVIPEAAHLPMLDAPAQVTEALRGHV